MSFQLRRHFPTFFRMMYTPAPSCNFQPHTTRYHPANAYFLGKASQIAYWRKSKEDPTPDGDRILEELQRWDGGFTDIRVFNHNSAQGFVARHQEFLIIAFRGTDEIQDWLDNLNLPPLRMALGSVHRGFYLSLMDIWPDMLQAIAEFQDQAQSLWITGHSLGGAMANMAALDFIEKDRPFYGVYTFGQPRCCHRDLALVFNVEAKSRYFRFQNQNDIVTRIPQRIMGYSHVGQFIYLDQHGNMSNDVHWWYRFVDSTKGILEDVFEKGLDGIKDHNMSDYVAILEKNINTYPEGL